MQLPAFAFLVLLGACSKAPDTNERFPSASARTARGVATDSCLAQDSWTLGPVALELPAAQALAAAGAPAATARDSSEDDGGMYELATYRYDAFEFDVVRGVVDRVRTWSPTLSTPWKVRVGLSRDSVTRALEHYGVRILDRPDTLDVPDCGAPSAYFTLVFDKSDRVMALELASERP